MTDFTAVVVLHDSEPELRTLLDSLDARLERRPQLVVVDSGSRDGGPGVARERGAEVLVLGGNPGFGAACNAGVARASHAVTVLLNPDCELLDGSLAGLAAIARAHPGALHAPRLLEADGSVQRSAHPLPGTAGAVAGAVVHRPLLPRALGERLEPHRARRSRTVGWATGACLAAATAVLRRLGPFDPAVHLFGEDMELCLRARAAGIPTVLHPQLRLRHAGGHATHRDGEPFDLLARRRREVVAAARGRRALAADDLAQALAFASPQQPTPSSEATAPAPAPSSPRSATPNIKGQTPYERLMRPVLLVSYAGLLGGAERVLLDWADALDAPLLACPEGPLAGAARAGGIEVLPLPGRSLRRRGSARSLAGLARDVAAAVARRRPRVVVASGQRPVLACAVAPTRGVPVLALHHDLPAGPGIVRAVRWATARCEAAVAVSETVARAVGAPLEVIRPGVDLARWRLPPPPEGRPPRALVLGALTAGKRPDLALEVAARLPGLRLELAGAPIPGDPPAFMEALRARAARSDLAGRVTFSGALADPRPALARAHLLLHCADRDGYGLALVEALAAGRPAVAPAAGGPAEILAGGGGRLFRPGDADDATRAVEAVLAEPAARAAARARAEAAFDGAAAARRFAAVLERYG